MEFLSPKSKFNNCCNGNTFLNAVDDVDAVDNNDEIDVDARKNSAEVIGNDYDEKKKNFISGAFKMSLILAVVFLLFKITK